LVSILTLGEGLHNNHHRFTRDASISRAWYEIDITGLIIRRFGKLGLVQDIFEGGAQATRSGNAEGGQRLVPEPEADI
jgi:stearoyl-CoA desaturase (delta-9 desaturase)